MASTPSTERGRAIPTPTMFRSKFPVLGAFVLGLVVTLAIAIPTDTSASHDFNDVPNNMLFHEEVSRIKDAGITTGCGGGNYCPWDSVSRLAMAAFMNRGFGRVAMNNTLTIDAINDSDGWTSVGAVTIDVPGSGASATQFVEVRGRVVVNDCTVICTCLTTPCGFFGNIWDPTQPGLFTSPSATRVQVYDTIEASWVFAATPGPHTYYLVLRTFAALDLDLDDFVMTATTYPFGAGGGNVLSSTSVAQPRSLDAATVDSSQLPHTDAFLPFKAELESLDSSRQ